MAQNMSLMDSFSQRERFIWHDDAFTIIIPNGTRTVYHPRASLSYLKALLIPQLRLTRGGNVSQHQPALPTEQPYDFYLAQLIHYGLDFHFKTETAQRALEIEIRLDKLRVPQRLLQLEKELQKEHERGQRNTVVQAARSPGQQQRGSNLHPAFFVDISKQKLNDETMGDRLPLNFENRERQKLSKRSSDQSDARSANQEVLSGFQADSGGNSDSSEESDTIEVATDIQEKIFSTRPNSSSDAVEELEYSDSTSSSDSSSDEDPEKTHFGKNSGHVDPFVDRRDFKRIKLEAADEHDDVIFRSAPEVAPLVTRKQPPPSQVKVRRIASHPQIAVPQVSPATKEGSDSSYARTDTFASGKNLARKPFVSPDKRPSWTIPVRSPSSSQNVTPKSVTFSQAQRETPTKVPAAEKATFASSLKTSQGSPHGRTPSPSSNHSQITPLRSILKKTNASPNQPSATVSSKRTDISVEIPRKGDSAVSGRRRRKRKSEADLGLAMDLDGAYDIADMVENEYEEKPFITSDIVNGKPISQKNNISIQTVLPHYSHDAKIARSEGRFLANNSKEYCQQLRAKKVQAREAADGRIDQLTLGAKLLEDKDRRSALGQAHLNQLSVPAKKTFKIGAGLGKHVHGKMQHMGNRSRGSLVRAGQIY